ncbi:hypothetical protein [Psychrobacillus sp. FSL K6-2843]
MEEFLHGGIIGFKLWDPACEDLKKAVGLDFVGGLLTGSVYQINIF